MTRKTLILLTAFLFAFSAGCSREVKENNGHGDGKCISGDCSTGTGVYSYKNGDRYEGEWDQGYRNGEGTLYYADGSIYKGSWSDGGMSGEGELKFSSGDIYTGSFKNGELYYGKYTYADGTIEEGSFTEYVYAGVINLPVSKATDKVRVGTTISADPESKEVVITGSEYNYGDQLYIMVESVMVVIKVTDTGSDRSYCTMIGQTAKYAENVKKGMPVFKLMGGIKKGTQEYLFPNGNRYVGESRGNLMNGKGTFYWTNGTVYTGNFSEGMRDGYGTIHNFDKTVYEGQWKQGRYNGKGKYTWPDGSRYEGEFKDGMRDGQGTYHWNDGAQYKGGWSENDFSGYGISLHSDGTRYEGDFSEGYWHGEGSLFNSDGTIQRKGKWSYGEPVEE